MRNSVARPPALLVERARHLARRDNHTNFFFIAADWLLVAAAAAVGLLSGNPIIYVLSVVAIGTRMRALANLMHEASHHKLFLNRRLNSVAGHLLCALPVAESLRVYTQEHRVHHRTLWISDDDPDRRLYRLTDTETPARTRMSFGRFAVQHVLLVLVPWQPARRLLSDRRMRVRALILAGASVVLLLAAPAFGRVVVLGWVVPWFTTYQMIGYWAELAEHGGLWRKGWDWGSRNWSGHTVSRWLLAAHSTDLYHLAHHWFPAVPHWRLAQLDQACRELWPDYAQELRCGGFFLSRGDRVSVLRDIWSGGDPVAVVPTALAQAPGAWS